MQCRLPRRIGAAKALTATTMVVGEVITLELNGAKKEFIVVQQGIPSASSLYDESCNGTWLLIKDIYEKRQWYNLSQNDYANSSINSYLNGDFISLFGSLEQSAIKQVKIPYRVGAGTGTTINSGANGLSVKAFLLGGYELGWTTAQNANFPVDGAKLDYFIAGGEADAKAVRVANFNGTATAWSMRSAHRSGSANVWATGTGGGATSVACTNTGHGIRPTIIINPDAEIQDNGDGTYSLA